MSYKSCAFTTFDKTTSIRVFLHPGTAESCSLMLNRIKINSHLLPINILRVFDISQDFYHSALKFFQWTFSLVKETLSTIYLQTAFSIPSSGVFFQTQRSKSFLKPMHGKLTFTSKERTSVSSLKTKEKPSLPYIQPHYKTKSLVTLTNPTHTSHWVLPARHSCANARTQNGYYKWSFSGANDLRE